MKKKDLGYLMTSFKGYPVLIQCISKSDIHEFGDKIRNSQHMTTDCAMKNINNGQWVNECDDEIAVMINDRFGDQREIWIRKEDAVH